MALIALLLVGSGVAGWLVADALHENHHRYRVEEERWHDAFERILAARLPPGPVAPVADPAPEDPREWRLVPASAQHGDATDVTRQPAARHRAVLHPFEPPV